MPDDVDDRLSKRFETPSDDNEAEGESDRPTESKADMSSSQSETDTKAQTSQNAQNIKKEWNVRSFYLDDDLDNELSTAFKRLDLELSEADYDFSLRKTRHFYPLVVELGLEQLGEMDLQEVTERLER